MNQEILNKLKKESLTILYIFLIVVIIIKIVAIKENLIIIIRTLLSFFWLFIIPGYLIMFYWIDKVNFLTRLLIGTLLTASILGITSYHLGIVGINIKITSFTLPIILIMVGVVILWNKLKD